MVLMEVFVVSCKWNFSLGIFHSSWEVRMALAFLEGLPALSNLYGKVKIFKIIKQRKLKGIVDVPFGLKRFFFLYKQWDKFLA